MKDDIGFFDKLVQSHIIIEELKSKINKEDYYIELEDLMNWYRKNIDGWVAAIRVNGEHIYNEETGEFNKVVILKEENEENER